MKCPKCGYLGFEPTDRCRNCGFDFSLVPAAEPASDAPLRPAQPMGPLADFDLGDARRPPRATSWSGIERRGGDASLDPGVPPPARAPAAIPLDLPLFGGGGDDDEPLVRPSAPGAPLSVRRSTPSRPRSTPAPRTTDRGPGPGLPLDSAAAPPVPGSEPACSPPPPNVAPAELAARFGAAALDGLLLAAFDAAVIYFTLQVSRLDASQILLLPPAPLAAFLLLLNGGYLALFTAATGQTIGKMAFGLRVVSGGKEPLTIGRTLLRVAVLIAGVLPAGLGLWPAAFDRARRGLHDRLADTRVVRSASS